MDYNLKNLSNIYNLDNLYDLDDLDDIENKKRNELNIKEIQISELKNFNNYLKKFIFLINDNKIYSLKCEFYSGNIIDINIEGLIINYDNKSYIAIGKLLKYSYNYVCISNFKDYNNNNINNIKIYLTNNTLFNNGHNYIGNNYIENNIIITIDSRSVIDINIKKNIEYNIIEKNIIFELIFYKYNNFLATTNKFSIKSFLVNYYYGGNNLINRYGYINLNNIDILKKSYNNNKYKNIDIIFKYVYNNKKLYLLLIKFGNIIFNDNNKCKFCEQLYKSFNNNTFIFKEIFKYIILCSYHYKIYFKKLNKSFDYIDISINELFKILSKN